MKLKFKEMLMIGAMGYAGGLNEGYSKAANKDTVFQDQWVSLVWYHDDFKGYYLKANDGDQEFTIEWRDMDPNKKELKSYRIITALGTTWTDTAKILVKAIKSHQEFIKD